MKSKWIRSSAYQKEIGLYILSTTFELAANLLLSLLGRQVHKMDLHFFMVAVKDTKNEVHLVVL